MTKHITYFDFLRGIAILMVIAIHTYVAGDFISVDGVARTFVRQIFNCAVPVFLALSGFFLGRKKMRNRFEIVSFWRKQIPKVYFPCIVWSVPLFTFSILKGGDFWQQLFYMFAGGFSVYYFIILIIQYYLLLPFLQNNLKRNLLLAIISSFVSILLVSYFHVVKGTELPLIVYAGPFVVWFVFFMLGVYFSSEPRTYSLRTTTVIVLVGILLEFIETYFLNTQYSRGEGMKLSAFIYSYGVVLMVLHPSCEALYRDNAFTSFIVYIGKISFGIYLIHCYVISVVIRIFTIEIWLIKWIVVTLVTILIVSVLRKSIPQNLNKYLGLS